MTSIINLITISIISIITGFVILTGITITLVIKTYNKIKEKDKLKF